MSASVLLMAFWLCWLVDFGLAYYGYFEFMRGVFGQYSAPTGQYITLWLGLLGFGALVIGGSLYLKNQGHLGWATLIAAIPVGPALLYGLWILTMVIGSKGSNWQ